MTGWSFIRKSRLSDRVLRRHLLSGRATAGREELSEAITSLSSCGFFGFVETVECGVSIDVHLELGRRHVYAVPSRLSRRPYTVYAALGTRPQQIVRS